MDDDLGDTPILGNHHIYFLRLEQVKWSIAVLWPMLTPSWPGASGARPPICILEVFGLTWRTPHCAHSISAEQERFMRGQRTFKMHFNQVSWYGSSSHHGFQYSWSLRTWIFFCYPRFFFKEHLHMMNAWLLRGRKGIAWKLFRRWWYFLLGEE